MSNTRESTVLSFEKTSEKAGAWLQCKIVGDDGKERKPMVTDATAIETIIKAGVGVYELKSEKNAKGYWAVVGAKFLRPLNGATAHEKTPGNPGTSYVPRNPGQTDPNTTMQNRSITSQVAMKVAGEVMVSALVNGAFKVPADKNKPEGIDVGGLSGAVNVLAEMLMETAGKFSTPKVEEKKDGTYKDEDGRTHEKVVEGA